MLGSRNNMVLIKALLPSALQAIDKCYSYSGNQVRVFTIAFFYSAPSGISGNTQHRGVDMMYPECSSFLGSNRCHLFNQTGIPGAGQSDCLREACCTRQTNAVESLSRLQMGNTQPDISVWKKRSQLMSLFLDGQSREKIVHPVFKGEFRVFVGE
ncbi:hypothetical protein ES703_117834 [subsurface metagenome]